MTEVMTQTAPYPVLLDDIVNRLRYRDGWLFRLADIQRDDPATHGAEGRGLTFIVTTDTVNSYQQDQRMRVNHYFIVPAATYNYNSWLRWVFDCLAKVELHECMEFFALVRPGEGATIGARYDHPFAALHGPGDDPYVVHEYATDTQARTSFRGEVKS